MIDHWKYFHDFMMNDTSKLNSKTVPVLSSLNHFFIFPFIWYLPRCTIPNFPAVSSPASLPFSSCCHRTTTTTCSYQDSRVINLNRTELKEIIIKWKEKFTEQNQPASLAAKMSRKTIQGFFFQKVNHN